MNTPFPIQPMDHLGTVPREDQAADMEDALGHASRGGVQAAFLGTSIPARRHKVGLCVALGLLGILLVQTLRLQMVHGKEFLALAEGNRIQEEYVPAHRGLIYDRRGTLLVQNQPTFSLWLDGTCAKKEGCYLRAVEQVGDLLGMTEQEVHAGLLEAEMAGEHLLVATDVSHDAAMRVLSSPEVYPSLTVESDVGRAYQTQSSLTLSALLGYVGFMDEATYEARKHEGYRVADRVGQAGLEASYEARLRGYPGERRLEVNARGEPAHMLSQRDAQDGANLTLHVDAALQQFIEGRLDILKRTLGIRNASVVVMDPRDGAVRALVSYPGFDTNIFGGTVDIAAYKSLLSDPARPLFSRALSGQFPSGSTFKPIVAAAALDEGIINERTSVLSTGGIRIGQFFFPDWRAGGHGVVDVREAIADSVNTFFYMIGGGYRDFDGLGLEPMMRAAAKFGLGKPLGIDLPQEASGFLPSAEWKERVKNEPWYIGDTYHVAIGQGDILVTPLQVASYTSVFANGGTLYQPQVVDRYEVQGRREDVEPRVLETATAEPGSIEIVRQGLRRTVTAGSARRLSILPVEVAGKTGTAQWHSEKPTHAWFTGFAPYQNPTLTVTVLIEEGGEGSTVAVPLAYDIFEWWFQHEQL